jgi:DNA-binding LacI/PurR family transcriptional regulator
VIDETRQTKQGPGKPLLRDVAKRAGVSAATVSRTLNGDTRVDPALQKRVFAAVKELGYRRNMLARNFSRQRLDAVGVIISDIENPHFSEMVKVIEEEGFRRGYRVVVCATSESADKQSAYLRMLADERVAGVIISPSDPHGPEIGELLDGGVPVVAIDREVSDPRADAVVADNVSGVSEATQLLVDSGHTRIAYIGGRRGVETSAERLAGYRQVMRAQGLRAQAAIGDFNIVGGHRAMTGFLTGEEPPTAVVVANNLMTLGAIRAAHDLQIAIPDDLALVGVDDPYWADFVNPPITSVAQPVTAMAQAAISILLTRLQGEPSPPTRSVHSMGLIVRASSAGGPRVATQLQA